MADSYNEATADIESVRDALNALLNVTGTVRLARQAVLVPDTSLAAVEGALVLAEREAERIYSWLDSQSGRFDCLYCTPDPAIASDEEGA